MKFVVLSVICVYMFNSITESDAATVDVGIYYESFDVNSNNFINKNLPLTDELLAKAKISIVPWGRTIYDSNTNTFTCTGGDLECHADRLHACAAKYHSDTPKQLIQFVTCTVKDSNWKTNPAESANVCANQVDGWVDAFPQLEVCSTLNDPDDVSVFLEMRDKTNQLNPNLDRVPWITINGKQNTGAETDLASKITLCSADGDLPEECRASSNNVKVGVYYESYNAYALNFIKSLSALPEAILGIAYIDFVPWGRTTYDYSTNTFKCTSGDNECHADRLHACAVHYNSETQKQLQQFVTCTVQHSDWKTNPAESANVCANQVDGWVDAFPQLEVCSNFNHNEYINVFLEMRDKTNALNPALDSIPWITINDVRNTDAENDLKSVICNNYNGDLPEECVGSTVSTPIPECSTQPSDASNTCNCNCNCNCSCNLHL